MVIRLKSIRTNQFPGIKGYSSAVLRSGVLCCASNGSYGALSSAQAGGGKGETCLGPVAQVVRAHA